MPRREPDVTMRAPIGCVDIEYGADDQIWPCCECLPWHIEIVRDPANESRVYVREWHAVDCWLFQELLKTDDPAVN